MKQTKKKIKKASPSMQPYWYDNKRRAQKDRDDQQLQRDLNFMEKYGLDNYDLFW